MPIPALEESGYLPVGVFECSVQEIESVFGALEDSVQRKFLLEDLKKLIARLIDSKIVKSILIDGSFVTRERVPGDIDLILIVPPDWKKLKPPLTREQYGVISARMVGRRYPSLELVAVVADASPELRHYERLFQDVKLKPGMLKGILRVNL